MDFHAILPVSVADTHKPSRALVRGKVIEIMCPDWCEADHIREHTDVAEVCHVGAGFGVPMPAGMAGERYALTTWEVSATGGVPRALVAPGDASAPGDRVPMDALQLWAFADRLTEHAARLRSLAVRLSAAEQGLMA